MHTYVLRIFMRYCDLATKSASAKILLWYWYSTYINKIFWISQLKG